MTDDAQLIVTVERAGAAAPVVHVDNVSSVPAHRISLSVVDPVSGLGWTRLLAPPPGRSLDPGERMTLHYRPVDAPQQLEMTLLWLGPSGEVGRWIGPLTPTDGLRGTPVE